MDNNHQTEILKEILELEIYLDKTQRKYSKLYIMKYKSAPTPPVCQMISKPYPEIKSQVKFNWIIALLLSFPLTFLGGIPFYYFVIYKKQKKEDMERIQNSEEYKMQCAAIDEEVKRLQETANEKYQNEMDIYKNEILPKYQKDLAEWTSKHNQEIEQIEQDIKNAQNKLSALYESSKIVPMQYRKIEILQYLYDIVSTSNYDITYAIENYDKYQQRMLDEQKIHEQQLSNQLANEQAQLLYEQNQISEKARRDANIASVVGTVQRHNTNKALKNLKR